MTRTKIAGLLCAAQFVLMLTWVILVRSGDVTLPVFADWSRTFIDAIPALWRYERFFQSQGREAEFAQLFTIHLPFVLSQAVILPLMIVLSGIRATDLFRRGVEVSTRQQLQFAFLIVCIVVFMALLFAGPVNVASPGWTNRVVRGSYFTYYNYVVAIPIINLLFFALLSLRRFQVSVQIENQKQGA